VLEVADILRAAGPEVCTRLAALPSQKRALQAILQCRTAELGGQVWGCEQCGPLHYSYHSCGNRHCPKCHGLQTEQWLQEQRQRLLPCAYYLLTFTLPAGLRALARSHQKAVYGLLLKAAAQSLQKLCADPQWLGAQPSMIGVLHTWTRAMLYHPHAHFLVSAGGLSSDGKHWQAAKNPKFLVPVRALSVIFRGKVRDGLKAAGLGRHVPAAVWGQKWVVHAQHAGSGQKVLDYLGRYVFRIAISNSRLESLENGQVTFRYRDNRTQLIKHLQLSARDFVQRWLQHVLPKGFAKVRHYGLAGSACADRRAAAVALLHANPGPTPPSATPAPPPPATPLPAACSSRCPYCGREIVCLWNLLPSRKIPP
jgi:Putative transposase/Transposase zinc-binding domain